MARTQSLTIDFDAITGQDWADAAAIMRAGGVDPDTVSLLGVQRDPATTPVPVLAALIYVTLRRKAKSVTYTHCIRLAQAVSNGG